MLGPLEALGPAGPVTLGRGKLRLLLSVLVLHAGELVSRRAIIDALWPEEPPPSAAQTVESYVSRLRAALRCAGAEGEIIASAPGGYRLVRDGHRIDCEAFTELARLARDALARGDAAMASDRAREAAQLWRGPALAGIADEPAVRGDAAALEEQRLAAFETGAEAMLALGRHAEAIPGLRVEAERHPERERVHELLMLALYRDGRQIEALEVYRAVRTRLDEELGLEPGPALRQLQEKVLHQDPNLDMRPQNGTVVREPAASGTRSIRKPGLGRAGRVGLAAALVAGLAILVSLVAGEWGRAGAQSATSRVAALGVFDSASGRSRAALALAGVPTAVASGLGSEWVTSYDNGTLERIDAGDVAVTQTVHLAVGAAGLAVAAGDVWVADSLQSTLTRVDASSNEIVQQIPVGSDPVGVAAGAGAVWVANRGDGTVTRIDPLTGGVLSVTGVGPEPSALAVGDGAVWVALSGAAAVARLDPSTGKLLQTIPVGTGPSAVAVGGAGVWVANQLDSTVSLINPASTSVVLTRAVTGSPSGLAAAGAGAWVSGGGSELTLVRPSGEIQTKATPSPVTAIATSPYSVLVGLGGIDADHRGGTLVARLDDPAFEVMDPSSCCDIPLNVLMLSYDGLLAFSKSPSSPGRLVPDLAIAVPPPEDGGLSYTFRLRPGLRYWTGAPVRASDFVRGFERAAHSSDIYAAYLSALPGATECPRAPSCDLAAAILANDQAGTVTLRLSHPDPNLLVALGQPVFAPDPGGTGIRPGTGPYRVARQLLGHLVDFERNPFFREWAPAAQPAGYPDRIVLHVDGSASADVAAVVRGSADWTFDQPTSAQLADVQLRWPRLLHTEPLPDTDWIDLDTRAAPFNDLRVRQALNFAIDRNAIVRLYGGPEDATPTCQVIPATIPGYVRYCPYTRDPSPTGTWTGPNLARAKRLIAASGTRGDGVTIVTQAFGPGEDPVAHYIVGLLRTLGYRARLRVLTPSQMQTYLHDDYHNPPQMHTAEWNASVPSASDWITLQLSCAAWHPPARLANHALFCDPAIDRIATQAAQLQTTNPVAADRLWARADRDITNLAPWIPTVTEIETDLVSARVGDYQYVPGVGALLDQLWVR